MYLDDALAAIERFEGRVNHLYLDSEGNVTVGVGQLVPSAGVALMMPFEIAAAEVTRPATPEEITADFRRVQGSQPGFVAGYYHWPASIFLANDAIDAMLRKVVVGVDVVMPSIYPKYRLWPNPAKVAVLDMAYNLGVDRLGTEYVQMNKDLRDGNFVGAATQCIRNRTNKGFIARNEWTINQFLNAAKGETI